VASLITKQEIALNYRSVFRKLVRGATWVFREHASPIDKSALQSRGRASAKPTVVEYYDWRTTRMLVTKRRQEIIVARVDQVAKADKENFHCGHAVLVARTPRQSGIHQVFRYQSGERDPIKNLLRFFLRHLKTQRQMSSRVRLFWIPPTSALRTTALPFQIRRRAPVERNEAKNLQVEGAERWPVRNVPSTFS
jgi:hypothetical protein